MSGKGSNKLVASVLLGVIVLSGAAVVALVRQKPEKVDLGSADEPTSPTPTPSPSPDEPSPSAHPLGRVKLTVALPHGSGLSAVGYVVQSSANIVITRGTIVVPDANATTVSQEVTIPAGAGDSVTFVGSSPGNVANPNSLLGRKTFDVAPGQVSEVKLTSEGEVGSSVGGPASGGGAGNNLETCQACELASAARFCDPPNLTATSKDDPKTGEQTGVGWGCATLPTDAARTACVALLHCLSVNDCEKGGQNPVMGCYCGASPAAPCLGGEGIDGVCIGVYQAAASASPGGPAAGSSVGQFSRFIAVSASDPTTPIGLADNLRKCAIDTPCDICSAL